MFKTRSQCFDKIMELQDKKAELRNKGINYKSTDEELQKAYGYLNYCYECRRRFKFLEAVSHSIDGNTHMFGCTFFDRFIGMIYNIFITVVELIMLVPLSIIEVIKWLFYRKHEVKDRKGDEGS